MARTQPGETFYSPLSGKVRAQIKLRQEITANNSKNAQDLAAINQNTGWVKVSSGSNILSADGQKSYSGPAQRFILHGGSTMTESQSGKRGVNATRAGVNFDKGIGFDRTDKAYNNYGDRFGLGYRPMPGITSFNLKTYNIFGTLRQADIQFVVWTLDDLEQAEKLYLRPGYNVIVEFGHSIYLDNSGDKNTFGGNKSALDENFIFSKQTIDDIELALENKRDETDCNYDGFFGFVTNFSYSFRPDGGYDCTMKVSSKGIILDSLATGETSDGAKISKTPKGEENNSESTTEVKNKSIFHTIFHAISDYVPDPNSLLSFEPNLAEVISQCEEKEEVIELFTKLDTQNQCKFIYTTITDPVQDQDADEGALSTQRLSYIPLRFVLDIFNKFASIYDVKDTLRDTPLVKFSLNFGNKFRTYSKHFSVAPSNVHLPKQAPLIDQGNAREDKVLYGMTADSADLKMEAYAASGNHNDGNGKNEILNIFLSTKILISIANRVFDKPDVKGKTIIDFINGILDTINTCLSDVTKLTLFYNEPRNEYEVVDAYGTGKAGTVPSIKVTGLSSTVKQLSIQSRLSSQTAAQISIAAAGNVDTYKDNVRAIRSWNLGSVDRFVPTKTTNPDQCDDGPDPTENKLGVSPYAPDGKPFFTKNPAFSNSVKNFFKGILLKSLNAQSEKDIGQTLRKVNLMFYELAQSQTSKELSVRHEIPIPVELGFTMKGIAGLKIGQVFKINPGVLLPKYDKYGYVITGVDNKIENNEWTTTVSSQFFELDNL